MCSKIMFSLSFFSMPHLRIHTQMQTHKLMYTHIHTHTGGTYQLDGSHPPRLLQDCQVGQFLTSHARLPLQLPSFLPIQELDAINFPKTKFPRGPPAPHTVQYLHPDPTILLCRQSGRRVCRRLLKRQFSTAWNPTELPHTFDQSLTEFKRGAQVRGLSEKSRAPQAWVE